MAKLKLTTIEAATAKAMADPNTPSLKDIQDNFECYQKKIDEIFGPLATPPIAPYQSTTGRKPITDTPLIFKSNYVEDAKENRVKQGVLTDLDFFR